MSNLRPILSSLKTTLRYNKKLSVGLIALIAAIIIPLSAIPLGIPYPGGIGPYKPYEAPSIEHLLGVDNFGNDMLHVLLYGAQTSLLIGFSAGTIMAIIAIILGLIAGYMGGLVDDAISRVVDIFLVIPSWPVLILLTSSFRGIGVAGLILVLCIFGWAGGVRNIRSQVLSYRERPFVDLAKISGFNSIELVIKEILPNLLPYLSVVWLNSTLGALLTEVGLEIIGLGPMRIVTIGWIFNFAIKVNATFKGWWWWLMPPTIILVWMFTSLYLITLGLDEISNPRLKRITGL